MRLFEYFTNESEGNDIVKMSLPLQISCDISYRYNKDGIDRSVVNEYVKDCVKDTLSPIITELKNKHLEISDVSFDAEDSFIEISCKEKDVEKIKPFLVDLVKKYEGEESFDETFELDDIDWPEYDAWDYGSDSHYTAAYKMSSQEEYEYFNCEVEVNVELTYNEDIMEVY